MKKRQKNLVRMSDLQGLLKKASVAVNELTSELAKYKDAYEKKVVENQSLRLEAKRLREELSKIKKRSYVDSLIGEMVDKRLVKPSQKEVRASELMDMDNSSLEALKNAIDSVEKLNTEKLGVQSFQYLFDENPGYEEKEDMLTNFSRN